MWTIGLFKVSNGNTRIASDIWDAFQPYQRSMVEFFCENDQRLLGFNYFRKKPPSQIIDGVLNTLLIQIECLYLQKQPSRGVLSKRCSESIQLLCNVI